MWPMDGRQLDQALLEFIAQPDETAFEPLALRLFAYQFQHGSAYGAFCRRRRRTPATVRRWQDIPPLPVAAFKELDLACEPAAYGFESSGTTGGERRSRNPHQNLDVWDASMETFFQRHVLVPDRPRLRIVALGAPWERNPHSSFSRYFSRAVARFGLPGSGCFADEDGLDVDGLLGALAGADDPVALLGPTFAFVHFFDICRGRGLRPRLPAGSLLVDGGGTKGRSREVDAAELYALAGEILGLAPAACVNEYGATELSSQMYDLPGPLPRAKVGPPWLRTRILDPQTLEDVAPGEPGLLCHYDLANRNSVLAVLTEDLGTAAPGGGIVLLGRLAGAEARGCSLAWE